MTTLNIPVDEQLLQRLTESARRCGLSVEEYARQSLETSVDRQAEWEEIKRYLLTKNAELYRRLA